MLQDIIAYITLIDAAILVALQMHERILAQTLCGLLLYSCQNISKGWDVRL